MKREKNEKIGFVLIILVMIIVTFSLCFVSAATTQEVRKNFVLKFACHENEQHAQASGLFEFAKKIRDLTNRKRVTRKNLAPSIGLLKPSAIEDVWFNIFSMIMMDRLFENGTKVKRG